WTLLAALVPVALALGVVLGGRAARADVGDFEPEAVLATWLLLAAAIGIGILPHVAGAAGPLGDSGGVLALQLVALAAGAAAGVVARRPGIGIEPAYVEVIPAALEPAPDLPRATVWATLAVAGVTAVAAAWLTVAGLRVGFL
ncbi:MAG TPA: hypothetical protein VEU29_04995, partial [Actinomycetota bacterium]|nr:hypothetical protein [Actinomycetota bacterium]